MHTIAKRETSLREKMSLVQKKKKFKSSIFKNIYIHINSVPARLDALDERLTKMKD